MIARHGRQIGNQGRIDPHQRGAVLAGLRLEGFQLFVPVTDQAARVAPVQPVNDQGAETARKRGLDLFQLARAEAVADQAGMAGESSGNAYRKVFQMSMNTGKIAKATKGTGLKLNFTDGKGEFAGMENMFAQLAKLKGLNTERRLQVLKGIYGDDAETHRRR